MGTVYGRVLILGLWFLAGACGGLSTDSESTPAPATVELDGADPSAMPDTESPDTESPDTESPDTESPGDDTPDREAQSGGSSDPSEFGIGGQPGVATEGTAGAGAETSSSGSAGAPSDVVHCRSDEYPEGETCSECLARCSRPSECESDPDCLAYRSCVDACEDGIPCEQGCPQECATGSEPVCYLMDRHHWFCSHACGGY